MPRLVKYGMIFSNAGARMPSQNYVPGTGVGARTISNRRRLMAKATDKTKPCSIKCNK